MRILPTAGRAVLFSLSITLIGGCSSHSGKMINSKEVSYSFKKDIFDDVRSEVQPNMKLKLKQFEKNLDAVFYRHQKLKESLDRKRELRKEARADKGSTPYLRDALLGKYRK